MNVYASCPCCSDKLIHHIGHHRDYWFCRGCWQEMPVIDGEVIKEETDKFTIHHRMEMEPLNSLRKTKNLNLKVSL